jgi:putative addiction module component (TIGR02574 family)
MSMASNPRFDFRELSIAERLQLVEDLWDSIAQDANAESLPVTDQEKALLDERLAELERDPDAGASWDEVKARILRRDT